MVYMHATMIGNKYLFQPICALVFRYISLGRIKSSSSLFSYNPGESPVTYNNTAFEPVFDLEDLPFFNMPGAAEVCGDSVECLFDVGSTGSVQVGQSTRSAQDTYSETVVLSQPGERSLKFT